MSYCAVIRSEEGSIQKVVNADGTESRLFNTIVKHPLVKTKEAALAIFKNKFSKVIEGKINTLTKQVEPEQSNQDKEIQKNPENIKKSLINLDKPKISAIFADNTKLADSDNPLANKQIQDDIKEELSELEDLINCIWKK